MAQFQQFHWSQAEVVSPIAYINNLYLRTTAKLVSIVQTEL